MPARILLNTTAAMATRLVFICLLVGTCSAHLCMLSPPQRTALNDINKPGSPSCLLLDPPCGKTQPSTSKLFLEASTNFTVVFQKNLDHFNSASPGYWTVSIGSPKMTTMKELYRVSDTNSPSLSLFTANITIPKLAANKQEPMFIQTTYVTKNPQAPPVFYQCADVVVVSEANLKMPVDGLH